MSKRRRIFRQPEQTRQANSPEVANTLRQAVGLHQQGQLAQAESLYRTILNRAPYHFDALHLLGLIEHQRKNFAAAARLIGRALQVDAKFAPAHVNLGDALRGLKRYPEALASYDRALAVKPDYAEALSNRGNALLELRRHEPAAASYDRALAIKPDYAEAFYNRGNALFELDRHEDAVASYDRALAIMPDHAEALCNRANALLELQRYEEAIKGFERLLELNPDFAYAGGQLLHARLCSCDWEHYDRDTALIENDVVAAKRAIFPFMFLAVSDSPSAQLHCAQIYGEDKCAGSSPPLWQGERYRHDRIRVAYLSADFHDHATAYLIAGLIEAHDKSRFDIIAISFGPDTQDTLRTRLTESFTRFIDTRRQSDRETALLLKEMEIDIAVDLKGYTQGCRPGILAFRPAPIQVNYLGYPGTMGADYIDYILADRFVIPEDQHASYTEKVGYLPDTYQPNDSKRPISEHTPTKAEAGLPETGFVFCSFNNNYKITPPVFDAWMRLLRQIEGSVLWLLEGNPAAVRNLRRNAQMRGVDPDRLVFAPRVRLEDHLARHRLADLFLDNVPYNAHTTASDALWAGLPVVTCLGSSFAGRVAGSLLNAAGLPELITDDLEDYEALALRLARDQNRLAAKRAKLARNRDACALFDTDCFRRHIESAYETMWERHQRGQPPTSFAVAGGGGGVGAGRL
jgi:protein O-GlcNAc transferase